MRPRTTGISASASPQEVPPQSFKPKSEWTHDKEASFLRVYLPGFQVDQLTISPDYSNRMVRLEGSRRLPNARLLPVNETFSIPEDCDLPKMEKQFGRGILMLTFRRNVVIPQQQTEEEPNEEGKTSSDKTSKPQDTVLGDLMTPKDEETDPLKATSTSNPKETVQGDSTTQKGEEIDPPKATSTGFQEQSTDKAAIAPLVKTTIDEQSTMKAAESDEQKTVEKKEENDASRKPAQPESPEHLLQNAGMKEEETKEKHKSTITSAMDVSKVEGKKVKKGLKFANSRRKKAEKENANTSTKKGMVKELNQDRKLIINIGAALLIIMGLGASLLYTTKGA